MGRWASDEWQQTSGESEEELDEEEELEGAWELDPNDPSHPDHDLSESFSYADWEPMPKAWLLRRGVVLGLTLLVLLGLLIPMLARIL